MTNIMRRTQELPRTLRDPDPVLSAVPRSVQRSVDRESARGLVAAARAQAAAYAAAARMEAIELAAERGMLGLDHLDRIQAALARTDPIKADRLAAFVDMYQALALDEIRRLPREL